MLDYFKKNGSGKLLIICKTLIVVFRNLFGLSFLGIVNTTLEFIATTYLIIIISIVNNSYCAPFFLNQI